LLSAVSASKEELNGATSSSRIFLEGSCSFTIRGGLRRIGYLMSIEGGILEEVIFPLVVLSGKLVLSLRASSDRGSLGMAMEEAMCES
jgi:hypothetical protein